MLAGVCLRGTMKGGLDGRRDGAHRCRSVAPEFRLRISVRGPATARLD